MAKIVGKRKLIKITVYFSGLFAVSLITGCGGYSLMSTSPQKLISIDGKISDWNSEMKFLKSEKALVGVKNDNNYVYISFVTKQKQEFMQITRLGFTAWIEQENGNNFGVEFPVQREIPPGMQQMQNSGMEMPSRVKPARNKMQMENSDPKLIIEQFMVQNRELRIVDEDNYPLNVISLDKDSGFNAAIGYDDYRYVYELQIPFNSSANGNFPSIADDAKEITIKLESGENDFNPPNGGGMKMDGSRQGGGMQPGMGGGGKRGSGRQNQPGIQQITKIDITLEIQLVN